MCSVAFFWNAAPRLAVVGQRMRYRNLGESGQMVLGRSVIALPSYSVSNAVLLSSDPCLLYPGSTFTVGPAPVPAAPQGIAAHRRGAAASRARVGRQRHVDVGEQRELAGVLHRSRGRSHLERASSCSRSRCAAAARTSRSRCCWRRGPTPCSTACAPVERSEPVASERAHPIEVLAVGSQGIHSRKST